ncbi:MAG: hypothetical protein GXO10_03385 [Crenarchaeota archaeon]|nr:hypothetical protein [Thermoproteota archaeon]
MLGYYNVISIVRSPNVLQIPNIEDKYPYNKLSMSTRVKSYLTHLEHPIPAILKYIYKNVAIVDFGRDTKKYPLASYYNIPNQAYIINIGYFHRPLYDIPFRDILAAMLLVAPCKFEHINIMSGATAQLFQSIITKVFGKRFGLLSHSDTLRKIYDVSFIYVTSHDPIRSYIKALSKFMPGFNIGMFITSMLRLMSIAALPLVEVYHRLLGAVLASQIPNGIISYLPKFNITATNILYKQVISLFQ